MSGKKTNIIVVLAAAIIVLFVVLAYLASLDDKQTAPPASGGQRDAATCHRSDSCPSENPSLTTSQLTAGATASSTSAAVIPGLKECGITEGKPIDRGFVFVEGRYVDGPYVVSRKGVCFYINNIQIAGDYEWPYPKFDIENDPGQPTNVTEKTTYKDIVAENYDDRHYIKKYVYLNAKYLRESSSSSGSQYATIQKKLGEGMAEYFRQYPCVKEAVADEKTPGRVIVKFRDGYVYRTRFEPIPPSEAWSGFMTTEKYIEKLERSRKIVEESLEKGECLLVGSGEKGPYISWSFSRDQAMAALPVVSEVIQSDLTRRDKITKIFLASDLRLAFLVDNFKPNENFMRRLKAFVSEEPERKPMSMAEIPTVEQWELRNEKKLSEVLTEDDYK